MKRKYKDKMSKAFSKILKYNHDWDYSFLLILERKKLQFMASYFEGYHVHDVSRDLRLCIRLLDIVLEEDAEYKSWQKGLSIDYDISESKEDIIDGSTQGKRQSTGFPKYINERNASRFVPASELALTELDGTYDSLSHIRHLVDVRCYKALHLYNLIRMYRMTEWSY